MTFENLKTALAQRKADYKLQLLQLTRAQKKLTKEYHKGNEELMEIYRQSAKKNSCSVARRINAAIWAAIGIALVIGVCYEWHKLGCGWQSLLIGAIWYTTACTGLGLCADETIKEHYQNQ